VLGNKDVLCNFFLIKSCAKIKVQVKPLGEKAITEQYNTSSVTGHKRQAPCMYCITAQAFSFPHFSHLNQSFGLMFFIKDIGVFWHGFRQGGSKTRAKTLRFTLLLRGVTSPARYLMPSAFHEK
jgi:hypothetical protein